MTAALAAVQSRIAEIQARFPSPVEASSFEAALAEATGARGNSSTRSAAWMTPARQDPRGVAWAGRLPDRARPFVPLIEQAAAEAGVDPRLLASVVWAESDFTPSAVSHAGAIGLGQLMPGTAAALGVDPRDPADNLRGAARYLREQLDRFGRVDLALAAYNAGPGRVATAGAIPDIAETRAYVPRVLGYLDQLEAAR